MSTRNLDDAHPTLRARYLGAKRLFLKKNISERYEVRESCVLRTDKEQQDLFWKSRYQVCGEIERIPGTRHVTYCDGTINKSKHQAGEGGFSRAVDFYLVNRRTGVAIWRWHPAMWLFAKICKEVGLECGRYWKMKDTFHIQMYDDDK